ncbi:UPF0496 protein 1-like [Salvia splendens]|uniref:UPF0496 protein 1-like n=1 Tax=Salvia splendens TaxID=180675 RepID=UPI001C25C6D8|nr:UPF0496 protein 1-like [Salvia splendens]
MAGEFVLAFRDLQKDAVNNEKLVDFVHGHYTNSLNAPEFYSALQQQCLHPDQHVHNLFCNLSFLYTDHFFMEETLKSMDESLEKQLCCVDVCKKASTIFFISAAMICAAKAATAAADANPKTKMTAAKAAAAAAAASILFGAVGKWVHSLLSKHESRSIRR